MKIVGVISSPKVTGNTATLVREALKGAAEEGAATTEIFLPNYKIDYCKGCFQCMAQGNCPLSGDDFQTLQKLIDDADGIIWGSPTYGATYNAMMKTFFERYGLFEYFTSSLGGKYMAGISASNGNGENKTARELTALSRGIFQRGYVSGILGVGFRGGKKAGDDATVLQRARKLGVKMVRDVKRHRLYPFQNILSRIMNRMILHSLFSKAILAHKEGSMKNVYLHLHRRELIG